MTDTIDVNTIAGIHQTAYVNSKYQLPVINAIITGTNQIANTDTTAINVDRPNSPIWIKSLIILYFKLLRYNKYIYYANLPS